MSAIFGLLNKNLQPVGHNELHRMGRLMRGSECNAEDIWTGSHIGLGWCPVSYTSEDDHERQPLVSRDKRVALVSDARLDNRAELSAALDISTAESTYLPDSRFILCAYEKWGVSCVDHLIGDYAFALWDDREQHYFLVRSPVGGRSLFYHASPELFAFASSPKGLFAHPSITRTLNYERIADYLVHAPVEPGASFFKNISRLHAGHSLTVSRDAFQVRSFWRPDANRVISYATDDEYVEAFNELFDRVVADHLRSKFPVGVMMSGGLDSASVAAVAATQLKKHDKRLATFTEVPRTGFHGKVIKGRYADETPFVRAMSRQYDTIDLNLVRTDGTCLLDDLDHFFDASYMPFRNASNRVWYEKIIKEARRKGVHVLLTGAQGNLTISRSGSGLFPQLIRAGKWQQAFQQARALEDGSSLRKIFSQGILPLLPPSLYSAIERMRGRSPSAGGDEPWRDYSAINPDFARAQKVTARAHDKGFDFLFRLKPDSGRAYARMLPGLTMTANDINHGYRMHFGVDVRDPTADARIVEFCFALPEEQYLKDGISRRLIRRSMNGKLPAEILCNRQRGLQAADWYERLLAARERLLHELYKWEKIDMIAHILDVSRMITLIKQMPAEGSDTRSFMMNYRQLLEFGLMTGSFIRWAEDRAHMHA